MTTAAWARLPAGLKQRPQWALAGASKAPLSVDANGKLYLCAPTRPGEWLSFEQVLYYANHFKELVTTFLDKHGRTITQTGLDIGYMLNEADEFCIIDLDVKDAVNEPNNPELWTTPDTFDFYWNIVQHVDSYTERSRSGKGLHIITEGKIGKGFRRNGPGGQNVEVYSQERFMICTGDIVLERPVQERQTLLTNMVSQMRPVPTKFELVELEEEEDDWSVLTRAVNASNSDKFSRLWAGKWTDMGFPSQSEADLALMSMLCFYSQSNAQCRRIFRSCALGQREKANKNDKYLNYTLELIRQRQERETRADISAIIAAADLVQQLSSSRAVTSLQAVVPEPTAAPAVQAPAAAIAASVAPVSSVVVQATNVGTPWPPGMAGTISQFMYEQAPRPVKEVAIVAALGLLAGIAGKAWHIPQSGLNLYIILVARSAVGKEAMHSGISAMIKACLKDNPTFHRFVDFTEYASGPALTKACVVSPSFVNVSGEWGRRLQRLAQEDGRDGPLQTLRTQMTNLYQKSGPAAIVGGIGYSSTDNNVASVAGVSYSMIGETTPQTFYKALTDTMMEDGFLSRFLVFEYDGERPPENERRVDYPDPALVRSINAMARQAEEHILKDFSQPLERTANAAALMKSFDLECDKNINATRDESRRQMWNRAALKSLRIAGLLAVADNWLKPCITVDHIVWAQGVVRRDIAIMRQRLDSGDVGSDDTSRERKLVSIIKDYLTAPIPDSYKVPDSMRQNGIVPRNYLQIRAGRSASFTQHKLGTNKALDDTLTMLISNGYLMDVQKDKVIDAYSFHGKAYRVVKLPDYDEQSHV